MDLKNNRITVGELLDRPESRAVFQRRFPTLLRHPLLGAARTVTLAQLIDIAGSYLPRKVIQDTLDELRRI